MSSESESASEPEDIVMVSGGGAIEGVLFDDGGFVGDFVGDFVRDGRFMDVDVDGPSISMISSSESSMGGSELRDGPGVVVDVFVMFVFDWTCE